jgi:hypothetical protein
LLADLSMLRIASQFPRLVNHAWSWASAALCDYNNDWSASCVGKGAVTTRSRLLMDLAIAHQPVVTRSVSTRSALSPGVCVAKDGCESE